MYIYIFGSICRGEIDMYSDTDLLLISNGLHLDFIDKYSIYSPKRIRELWEEGNPFAWHLHTESRLVFSPNGINFLENLGTPNKYSNVNLDLEVV